LNALQAIVFKAGQKTHESLYGASVSFLGQPDNPVPCSHSEIINDFELIPGGKSPKLVIENLFFRAETLPGGFVPAKGILCTLNLGDGSTPVSLRLWHGGLQPGGFIYKFMAVDANYKA
jgi:hypothetical protein